MTVNWRRETNSRLKSSQTEHSRVRNNKNKDAEEDAGLGFF